MALQGLCVRTLGSVSKAIAGLGDQTAVKYIAINVDQSFNTTQNTNIIQLECDLGQRN